MTDPRFAHTRTLPANPHLGQLRKQAKDLLRSFKAGEPHALKEVQRFERKPNAVTFSLADAQRVLARTYGFSSWTRLKQHVDGVNADAFIQAAAAGDVGTVQRLAATHSDLVNTAGRESGEKRAIHFAVLNRDVEMTRVLMQLGADARRGFWPYRDATTAHVIASDRGYDDIVAIIGAEERQRMDRRSPDNHASADVSKADEVAKAILEDRCEDAIRMLQDDSSLIHTTGTQGSTPLHVAAWKHNPEMVQRLLEHGAQVDAFNPFHNRLSEYPIAGLGRTPLDYAATVAGWAASKKYYDWGEGDDRFPYLENRGIAPARFEETVRLLRQHGAELTPRAAAAIGDQAAVRAMHADGRLETEIHHLRGGLVAIATRVNRLDMVRLLLDLGFDPDEPAEPMEDGSTSSGFPLWFASMCGRHDIAELLLDRGADPNAIVFASGDSMCGANATRDEKMRSLLLKHGARLTVENLGENARETARAILDGRLAAQSLNVHNPTLGQLAEQLLWANVDSDPEIVRMCLPHVEREVEDSWWASALMGLGEPESVKLILQHGVHPDVAQDGGPTPLQHLASDYVDATGHGSDELRVTCATILLDAGASLTCRDDLFKSTPLGWACRWGCTPLIELYLGRGADPVESEAEPWATPMAWATKGNHTAIIDLLMAGESGISGDSRPAK